jgi:hypothetical protein
LCHSVALYTQPEKDMQILLENGIHDIPNDVYHSSAGVSRSGLMELKRSPYHYWYRYLNPEREPEKTTPAMKLGELVHALVLEPSYFEERYCIPPELAPVPKVELLKDLVASLGKEEGRKEYEIQKAERDHIVELNEMVMASFANQTDMKEIIKPDMYMEARGLADVVLRDPMAQQLFTDMKAEKSIYFTHKGTGLQCKVRPDAWLGTIVTDLKTCADARLWAFQSEAYKSGYFIQAAMMKQAFEAIGERLDQFIFFCVEKTPAKACVYYPVDEESLYHGEKEFDGLMYRLAECMQTNVWRSYETDFLSYPNYAKYEVAV